VRRALPPHGWHQDGALHHDFLARPTGGPPPLLLPMWTAWIALTPCGTDAPSLAWVRAAQPALLPVEALTDAAVRARGQPIEHAVLAAGDALLFDGHLLHATHHTPQMLAARTSIELRCIAAGAAPAPLQRETLRTWV
jgi:ectoine hydroxylase-related dioxygenase (phytanoyl-CoA dioxygenase family)